MQNFRKTKPADSKSVVETLVSINIQIKMPSGTAIILFI